MNVKVQGVFLNEIKNASGVFDFFYPAQSAALASEERQNALRMQYNAIQDALEARTSESLTKLDNQKFIIAIAIIAVAIIIYSQN